MTAETGEAEAIETFAPTTRTAREAVIRASVDLPDDGGARAAQVRSLSSMLRRLIAEAGPHDWPTLREHFVPAGTQETSRGWFVDADNWFREVGEDHLVSLPGVTEHADGLAYHGLDEGEIADLDLTDGARDAIRPLADLREDVSTRTWLAAIEHHSPHADAVEDVLQAVDVIRSVGPSGISTVEIREQHRLDVSQPEIRRPLESIEGIDREVVEPLEPEEIEVDTLADVVSGFEEIEREPEPRWRVDREGRSD